MIRTALGIVDQKLRSAAGLRPLPRILTWTLGFRCNARCGMCDSWRKDGDGELSPGQALELVERLPRTISAVRLTGGEPFLRGDLEAIVRALDRRLDLDLLHVTTNGFLTDRIGRFLDSVCRELSCPLHVLVSLDGMEELHDEIRGRPFAFRSALETIRRIARRRGGREVELSVNQTIVDERGIAQYGELHELLGGMGVPHHVVVAYAESATYSTRESADLSPRVAGEFRTVRPVDPDVFREFMDRVRRDARSLPWANAMAKAYYLEGIRNRVLDGVAVPNPRCAALGGHMRIFPNGDVPTCQFNSGVVGNIMRTDFDTLWNSPRTLEGRAWVEKCPGCWAECEVLPSAILGGDLLVRRPRRRSAA